jgi:hypothetical protein
VLQKQSNRPVRAMLFASPGAVCVAPGPRQAGTPSVLTAAAAAARLLQLQQTPAHERSS